MKNYKKDLDDDSFIIVDYIFKLELNYLYFVQLIYIIITKLLK